MELCQLADPRWTFEYAVGCRALMFMSRRVPGLPSTDDIFNIYFAHRLPYWMELMIKLKLLEL